jgi:hypothetical protein
MNNSKQREDFEAAYRARYKVPADVPLDFPDVPIAWEWWQAALQRDGWVSVPQEYHDLMLMAIGKLAIYADQDQAKEMADRYRDLNIAAAQEGNKP